MDDKIKNIDNFKCLNILIVDDSKTSAMLIRQQIHSLGTPHDNIHICSSYQEAVKCVSQCFYNVLIVDYHLEQRINGNELVYLLRKKNLLNYQTGIIVISGDSSQETVLTVLSSKVQHFIKKPIQTQMLAVKIINVRDDQKSIAQAQKLIANEQVDLFEKADELSSIIDISPSLIVIESNILDTLEEQQQWALLSLMLQRSTTPMHMSKVSSIASDFLQQGRFNEASQILENFLISNPLAHKALDKLAYIYDKLERPHDALRVAIRAFECTPSIQRRMLTAAKLSAKVHNTSTLISIGKAFAQNLSIMDISWLSGVICYSDCVLEQLQKQLPSSERKQLVSCMIHFFKIVNQKVTVSQRPFLICYKQLFSAYIYLMKNRPDEAHQCLFKAISPHYDLFDKLPTALMVKMIHLAEQFGEIWLSEYLLTLAATRDLIDKQTKNELMNLTSEKYRTDKVRGLKQKLQVAKEANNTNDPKSYTCYQVLLDEYPLCVEAQLGLMKASILFNRETQYQSEQLDKLMSYNYLPTNWRLWLEDIKRVGINLPLPDAL
ncbi:response regulator [Vibrio lentus]|uniref:Response regulatory domain-containing protein n=1 Tax=Vibrio lentus TaxID=136468 RepID=A0A2N7K8P8_9VIBR|nr:response regulator [Vibrio lentus]PMM71100.1 hypothetical protein BCT49_05390 [Vibrio lentus]